MAVVMTILVIIAALFVIFKIYRNVKKHTAATNALVAKATYHQLDTTLQMEVVNRTLFILQCNGGFSPDTVRKRLERMEEKAKYGFFALAMLELAIEPISHKWQWQTVGNPFVALIGAEKQINMARLGLQKEGIEVTLAD